GGCGVRRAASRGRCVVAGTHAWRHRRMELESGRHDARSRRARHVEEPAALGRRAFGTNPEGPLKNHVVPIAVVLTFALTPTIVRAGDSGRIDELERKVDVLTRELAESRGVPSDTAQAARMALRSQLGFAPA